MADSQETVPYPSDSTYPSDGIYPKEKRMAFLDSAGLATLWAKIKSTFASDLKISGTVISLVNKASTPATLAQIELPVASSSNAGVMSTTDKSKLDGIASGANKYVLPTASTTLGGVKTTSTVTSADGYTATPIIGGVPYYKDTNTTYSAATSSAAGLMSATDKSKLDGIASGANKTTVDSAMSSSSTNPVQNKVVNTALAAKANLASPALTGTPTAPTAAAGTSTSQIATTAFVAAAVANGLGTITGIDFKVVESLPTTGTAGTIYLMKHSHSDSNDAYDEYVYVSGAWEKIGNTDVDLSNYWNKDDLKAMTSTEIAAILV